MQYTIQPPPDVQAAARTRAVGRITFLQRIMLFCTVAAVTLSVYAFREDIAGAVNQARMRRGLAQKEAYASSRIYFEPDSSNLYGLFEGGLAVLNKGTYKLYAADGTLRVGLQPGYSRPGLSVSDKYVVLFDRGNRALLVTDGDGIVQTIETEGSIISVSQNADGLMAVVRGDSRHRAVVSVYDNRQSVFYEIRTSEYYISDAVVSPNGRTMAITALTQKNGDFFSKIVIYSLDSDTPRAAYDMTGTLVASLHFLGNDGLCAVGDDAAVVLSLDGKEMQTYRYGVNMLKTAEAAQDYVVLAMLNRTSGLGSKLVRLDAQSVQPLEWATEDEVRRLSAEGDMVGVLYTDSVEMLNRDFQEMGQPVRISGVRDIAVHPDGVMMMIYSSEAGYLDIVTPFVLAAEKSAADSGKSAASGQEKSVPADKEQDGDEATSAAISNDDAQTAVSGGTQKDN